MPAGMDDVEDLVAQLSSVERTENERYGTFTVAGHPFGYRWPRTRTVGLKQTLSEQAALVAERPATFEIQFTTGSFGWVVIHLDRIERDELAELLFEAWRLTAPEALVRAAVVPR